VTRGCLEAVLIPRGLDEPGFCAPNALIDRERLAQVPGGLGSIAGNLTAAEAGQRPGSLRRCAQLDRAAGCGWAGLSPACRLPKPLPVLSLTVAGDNLHNGG
jgi:hypothetical protein